MEDTVKQNNKVKSPDVTAPGRKRMANMELLRILSMFMVVMLHYLGKGQLLMEPGKAWTINGYVAQILETLSIVAVNVYMLISGYFLVESGFKCRRLIQLFCQVLFYSILVPALLMVMGVLPADSLDLYKLLQYCFPAEMEHYWFVTAYVIMYLFSPLLSTAVKHMGRKQLKYLIIMLLLFFSVNKSILPVSLTMDHKGYDGLWFLCVYLIAAYIRLYGIPFYDKKWKGICGYLAGCAAMLGIMLVMRAVFRSTGKLEDALANVYHYNHIINIFAAVSLFYAFFHIKLKDGWLASVICRTAKYTFGVYLLHEHIEVRYLWPGWLGADLGGGTAMFFVRTLLSVIVVFMIGVCADAVRNVIFTLAGKILKGSFPDRMVSKVDGTMAGISE